MKSLICIKETRLMVMDFQQLMAGILQGIDTGIQWLVLPLLNAVLEIMQNNPVADIAAAIGFGVLIGATIINLAARTIRDQF